MAQDTLSDERGGLTSPVLSGRQANLWTFVDQLLVKYGPLSVMLIGVCYYIVIKDDKIAEKDRQIMEQQKVMLEITKASTDALVRTSGAQIELARSVDANTQTMTRLVALLERQAR